MIAVCQKLRLAAFIMGCIPVKIISRLWRRNRKVVAIGAWYGKFFIGAPRVLAQYLLDHTNYEVYWIGREEMRSSLPNHPHLHWVKKDSWKASLVLLNAKFWVCCISIEWDLTFWPISEGAVLLNTWHGFGLKKIGRTTPAFRSSGKRMSLFGHICKIITMHHRPWTLMPCQTDSDRLSSGEPFYFRKDRFLPFGTPNNDYMIWNRDNEVLKSSLKQKYAQLLGFDSSKKIVLYFPTWRITSKPVFSFYGMAVARQVAWRKMLDENNAVLIEKHHYRTFELHPQINPSKCSVVVRPEHQSQIDIQEMLLFSDVLVSDYSGAYIDFGLMHRPCIHFAYDFDEYASGDSGFYYNLRDVAAGPIVSEEEGLFCRVAELLKNPIYSPAPGYERIVEYEKGISCQQIVKFFKGAKD